VGKICDRLTATSLVKLDQQCAEGSVDLGVTRGPLTCEMYVEEKSHSTKHIPRSHSLME
jgi:hypothetical protein